MYLCHQTERQLLLALDRVFVRTMSSTHLPMYDFTSKYEKYNVFLKSLSKLLFRVSSLVKLWLIWAVAQRAQRACADVKYPWYYQNASPYETRSGHRWLIADLHAPPCSHATISDNRSDCSQKINSEGVEVTFSPFLSEVDGRHDIVHTDGKLRLLRTNMDILENCKYYWLDIKAVYLSSWIISMFVHSEMCLLSLW